MKKKFIIISIFCTLYLILYTSSVVAASPLPSPKSTEASPSAKPGSERQEQIKELKDRLATRVAELRQQMRRVLTGEIKTISGKNLTLTTKQGDKIVVTDEQTIFIQLGASGRKEINFSNLKAGQSISAFGLYDETKGQLAAKVIISKVLPLNFNGKITEIDISGGTISVQTPKNGSYIVDIENYTKISVWDKDKGIQKYGLSKLKVGDRVHINANQPTKSTENNRVSANRILVLPGNATGIVSSPKPTASPTATPKASPKPTSTPAE